MTRPKHTPGPWTLCAHLSNIDGEIGCSCGYRGVIFGPESAGFGYAICQPGHEPAPPGQEGTEPPRYDRMTEIANAHLIAASPDLLEAGVPFSALAGKFFENNYNASEVVATFAFYDGSEVNSTAGDFFSVRRAVSKALGNKE